MNPEAPPPPPMPGPDVEPIPPFGRFRQALALSPRAFAPPIGAAGWLVPLLIVVAAQLTAAFLAQDLLMERWQEQATRQIERNESLTPEQRVEALEAVSQGPAQQIARVANVVAPLLLPPLAALMAALALLAILNFGMGGRVRFAGIWPVACLAWAPKALEAALFVILAKSRGSADILFGPAALLADDGSLLRTLLSVFDVFQLWMLGIHVVGLSMVEGVPRGRARTAALVLWIGFWGISLLFAYIGHKLGGGA